MAVVTSPKCNHHSKLKDAHQPPAYPKAQPEVSLSQKCKKTHPAKKKLLLGSAAWEKQALADSLKFSQCEEEDGEEEVEDEEEDHEEEEEQVAEGTGTSSKGKYD